jgi:ComF family protein
MDERPETVRDDCGTRRGALLAGVCDLMLPRACAACGAAADRPGSLVCWDCFRNIELLAGPACARCGLKVEGALTHDFLCGVCRADPPAYERARVAGRFRGVLRVLLHAFKYEHGVWLCRDLTDLLHGCVLTHFAPAEIDIVLPVPLAPVKRRARSYNQAALLARELAARLDRPCLPAVLQRLRNTPSQTRLSAAARRANVLGAFAVTEPGWVRGRTVMLIDDVMTTGATLHEAARALRKAGAPRVWAAAVARG